MKTKMSLFWRHDVYLFFLLFSLSTSIIYPSQRCYTNNCLYRLPDLNKDTCKIYNTSVCLNFYNLEGISEKISEEESRFFVSIVPYTAELFVPPATVTRSAINFTFTIDSSDINELVVKISTKVSSKPICRVFDFQNVNVSKMFPINLFYDCLFNMVEHGMQNVHMDFITLPVKEKLSYHVFIPGTKYPGSCIWQPLIMVFNGGLRNAKVQMKFSQAPELFNISSYVVKLTENLTGVEKIVEIMPNISSSMLFVQFSYVDGGVYFISVKPLFWGLHDGCWSKTDTFLIEIPKSDYMLTVYLCVFILLIFIALIFLKMFGRNIYKLRYGSKRQILLIYSHDCNEHADFVNAFINFLTKCCAVEVSTIYGDESNPQEWINKKYQDCEIIMYLISAGLFHTLDSKGFLHLQTAHEWRKQLLWSTHTILSELLNNSEDIKNKKICKVCFSYSSKEYIPDILRVGFGKCFSLPQEMGNLINFMHDSGECFLCNKLCFTGFESSSESAVLCEKLKVIQAAVDNNSHISIIRPLDNTSRNKLTLVDFSETYENSDESSTTSDENSDSFLDFLSGDKKRFSIKLSDEKNRSTDKNGDFVVKFNPHEPLDDSEESSDCENSEFLYHYPKLYNEDEAKCVIENILNKDVR